ncbi:MAG: hypothetical protein HQL68_02585 [Magnetococcales bacterium]|nr:hypothetical protein [Magnetococcales bacterium]
MIADWRNQFEDDPEKAVADLFSGRAGVGSGLRLDIPELLYQEFPPLPQYEDKRKLLDKALLAWLHFMRRDYAKQVGRLGYNVYCKRICDGLISAQLLKLPTTIYQVREMFDNWLRWLKPLRLAPERDPALESWRLLTQLHVTMR